MELYKSKMIQRIGYHKGTFVSDTEKLADIVGNGAQIEIKAQKVREIKGEKIQVIECRIFFISKD